MAIMHARGARRSRPPRPPRSAARSIPPAELAELARAARRGDVSAEEALVRQLQPLVDRAAASAAARRGLSAPDLAQDTWLELVRSRWASLTRYDPGRSAPATFVGMIVHRRAARLARREARPVEPPPSPLLDGEARILEQGYLRGRFEQVLAELRPPGPQILLLLAQGESAAAIARQLGCTTAQVYAWTYRARRRADRLRDPSRGTRRPRITR